MLFNNFVEGSLKLNFRCAYYTNDSEKNKNEGIHIFLANCSIDRNIVLIYIYILLQIFLKSFDASNLFNINFP